MVQVLEAINRFVWGVPALVLIVGVGIYLSLRTKFVQFALFPKALSRFLKQFKVDGKTEAGTSSYRALCTALAATVGTGNLAGVAGALALGGPGVIFWMWICGLLGMMTKFAEAALSVVCRCRNADGELVSGPMYMIRNHMGKCWQPLAGLYCFFGVVAAFGVGNATQVRAVMDSVDSAVTAMGGCIGNFGLKVLSIVFAIFIGLMLSGGARRIGTIAEKLVPFAACFYILFCVGALCVCYQSVPAAFSAIFAGAFSPKAVTGGVVGSVFSVVRIGAARGVFTNEAGMGTAAIAHGSADVTHPVDQGLMGIMEVFLDTIVICTLTALVILCSGVPLPYGVDTGMLLTVTAFSSIYGAWISVPLSIAVSCFAIATILGWSMYGARCAQYLFGSRAWQPFVVLQTVTVLLGAVMNTGTIWLLSEIFNGLMAIPNLIVLAYLAPKLSLLIKDYKTNSGVNFVNGGTNEDFNQRQPLRTLSYEKISPPCGESEKGGCKDLPSEYWSA